jgi:hypothetical protein
MDRGEVLKVNAVLDELEQVHANQPRIVFPPPKEATVVDRGKAFQAVRWLERWAVIRGFVAVVDEHPAVQLFDRPRPRAMTGVWLTPIGPADDTPVSADPPPVERTLDGIALHLSVGQVGAEVGAIRIDRLRLTRGIAKHDQLVARTLHERRAIAKVDRSTDDVPTLGVRRRIAGLTCRLDDGI